MKEPFFHRKMNPAQRGNYKFFGLEAMLKLIEF